MAANGGIALAGLPVITFCIYLGAMGKSAQFPLHIWLPDAMEGPTPVSALIHAATMVTAGVYLLHRTAWLFALTPDVLVAVAWIGAFTALLAAVLACVQDDIKRVLAYSTVSQLGYMMTAIGAGVSTGRLLSPAHPRRVQGPALPRRRSGHSRRREATTSGAWEGCGAGCRRRPWSS
jgi:NADH:ubiquinone oxidoreductase subunit 5 (subunit L)/multisubunit Na+/H+ antiporter MnhA subunit